MASPTQHHQRSGWRWIAGTALALGGTAAIVARHRPVPSFELHLTTWLNRAPDWVAWSLWPVMQVGTVFGPVAFGAALLVWRRDVAHAAAVVVGGVSTWFLAKAVKAVVQRQRPAAYLPHIHVRDGNGLGLGFVSGHSAVAACIAVCIMPVVSKPWRWAMATIAGVVGIARIVHGVHLPADVVGGWSLGTLVGLPAWGCVERVHRRISPST